MKNEDDINANFRIYLYLGNQFIWGLVLYKLHNYSVSNFYETIQIHIFSFFKFYTVVGDNINIMKTTFELNFNSYQAFKQQGYPKIWKQREAVNLKSFTLNTCKLVIRKKAC